MKLEHVDVGPVTILRLEGDIDEEGVKILRLELLRCIKTHRCNLVVNLSGVRLVSWMGLGVLVERLRQCRACGGDLKLVGVNLSLDRMLRQAAVGSVFETYENESNAVHVYQEAA
ncbi:MAG TPA: STAS domain-containing protein [Candidatus Hydrogenedentes bacterium]|nr:STAS domain-containing protein [Candidatus Hydrogenedentota bacterium]HPG68093.1 STAS domain-containing protein [Candidatus Hydrogenedentota bacterium]